MTIETSDQRAEALRRYQTHREQYQRADRRYRAAASRVRQEASRRTSGGAVVAAGEPDPDGCHHNLYDHWLNERDAALVALRELGPAHKGSSEVAAHDREAARQEAVQALSAEVEALEARRDAVAAGARDHAYGVHDETAPT